MYRRGAQVSDGSQMRLGTVTFMRPKSITGIAAVQINQDRISGRFSQHRGRRDAQRAPVPFYQRHLRQVDLRQVQVIQ